MAIKLHDVGVTDVIDDEKPYSDLIFCGGPNLLNNPTGLNSIIDDPEYRHPDRTRYVFTNMGNDIYMLDANNIVSPVRYKHSLTNMGVISILEKTFNIKSLEKGIFVVDYIHMYNTPNTKYAPILDYYMSSDNVEISSKEKEKLLKLLTQKVGRQYASKMTIRLINFIPASALDEYNYVYSKAVGLCFTNGELTEAFTHPSSKHYTECYKEVTDKHRNVIVIDIVNNEKDTSYFMKIGNQITRVLSRQDPTAKSGCTVVIKKNGSKGITKKVPLSDTRSLGVYKTHDEAYAAGDISLMNEKEKIEIEKQKIKNEMEKLKTDIELYRLKAKVEFNTNEQKLQMSILDMRSKLLSIKAEEIKVVLGIKQANSKYYAELSYMYKKQEIEITKAGMDLAVKVITVFQSIYKLFK